MGHKNFLFKKVRWRKWDINFFNLSKKIILNFFSNSCFNLFSNVLLFA